LRQFTENPDTEAECRCRGGKAAKVLDKGDAI
jgi:hypothetical protein